MGARGRALAEQHYDAERVANRLLELMNEIAGA
jgi:hypothetical protein